MKNTWRGPARSPYKLFPVILLLPFLAGLPGCVTGTPDVATPEPANRTAMKILDAQRVAVAAAIRIYNANVQAGHFSELERQKVIALRAQYLAADKMAVDGLAAATITNADGYTKQVVTLALDLLGFLQSISPPKVP